MESPDCRGDQRRVSNTPVEVSGRPVAAAIASISTRAALGSAATAKVERAG